MAYAIQPNLGGLGVEDNGGIYTTYTTQSGAFWSGGVNIQNAISSTSSGNPDVLFENDLLSITGYVSGSGNTTTNNIYLNVKSNGHNSRVSIQKRFSRDGLYLWFAYDDDLQKGTWGVDYADSGYYQSAERTNNNTSDIEFYTIIKGSPFITYQWSSVPAISGKNGILSLPTLFSQPTDGNPVTDADYTDFFKWNNNAELVILSGGKILNEETEIVISGDDFICTATWNSTTSVTVKFYLSQQTTPFASITYSLSNTSDEIFFAMLEDIYDGPDIPPEDAHRWGRPSFIIKNGVTGKYSYNTETVDASLYDNFYSWIIASMTGGYSIFGPANDEEGGDGYGIPNDEPIPEPTLPTISSLNLNMTKMYKCTKENINDFWTWLNDPDTQLLNNLFGNDPIQGVIGINICPVAIEATGNPEIKFLGLSTGVYAPRVTDQFQDIDCGTVTLDAYMHNTYLDFAPYTRIKCIIPYVGAIELDPDDVMPSINPKTGKLQTKKIQLKLRLDVLTGVCVAHIYVNNSLHYEAGGSINIPVPMTQKDYTEVANAVRRSMSTVAQSIAQSAVIGAMTGGMAGAGVGVAGSLIASGMDIALSKPKYTYVQGGAGASASFLGIDRPYIMLEIPKLARPKNDEKFFGMPSYITGKIKTFTGFAKFKNPHMDTLTCTEREKDEIVSLLANGIINQVGTSAESSTPSDEPTTSGNTVITFLKNLSDRNVMGKTFSDTTNKVEGKLIYDNSITTPVFLINGDITGYNYAYIGLFGRFYYITDVVVKNNGMCEVHLNSDPLQSFKADIKEREAICERSQNRNNFYINDGALLIKQDSYIFTKQFEKSNAHFSFSAGDASYTLILADA